MQTRALKSMAVALILVASCSKNSSKTPTITPLKECTADGEFDCLTTAAFPAAVKATLVAKAGDIRTTTTIGGVTGTLADCAGDNGSSCVTSAAFPSVIKNAITPAGIMSGKVVAGITGTFAPPCSADGQIDCLTTTAFKAGDSTTVSAFDLRAGKNIGGIAGKLTFAKNGADTSTFNRTAGIGAVASAAVADLYDSIDDYNDNSPDFPTEKPAAWLALTGHFVRDAVSDTDANGECNGSEDCVYRDLNTGLYWARSISGTATWENAITICENLDQGTYTDWRLPSQKELMQAYIDGIFAHKTALNLTQELYQSSTTRSAGTTENFQIDVALGQVTVAIKASGDARTLCTR